MHKVSYLYYFNVPNYLQQYVDILIGTLVTLIYKAYLFLLEIELCFVFVLQISLSEENNFSIRLQIRTLKVK